MLFLNFQVVSNVVWKEINQQLTIVVVGEEDDVECPDKVKFRTIFQAAQVYLFYSQNVFHKKS